MTSADVVASRPVPPPSTKSEAFAKELAEIKKFSTSSTKEQQRIVTYWADGVGTYTLLDIGMQ